MKEKIHELLPDSQISLNIQSQTKEEVLNEMVDLMESSPHILDKNELLDNLMARERLETTGIGEGIAFPHARTDSVSQLVIGFGRSEKGVEYDSLDGKPVHILIFIAAPLTSSTKVLQALAKISRFLNKRSFREKLLHAQNKQEIKELFKTEDQ